MIKKVFIKIKEKIKQIFTGQRRLLSISGLAIVFVLIFFSGALASYFWTKTNLQQNVAPETPTQKDVYLEFLSEVYDKIKENYWESITEEQLDNLFKLGVEKLTNKPQDFKLKNKEDFKKMLTETMKIVKEDKKKEFTVTLAHLVLLNLKPSGRSALYTTQDKENLKNRVQNINPEVDLYKILGVEKDATPEKLEEVYKNKVAELEPKKDKSEEAKKELEQVKYAYEILSDTAQKQRYDQAGVEPTVFAKLVRPDILHLYIKKLSPTTLDELKKETEKFDNITGLDTLILDLRGNVGGSIDLLSYLLGPFIGGDQYAYDFFRQEEKTPFKTKIGWLPSLVRYKKIVILIDNQTQSSAEVMAATLKKYNVGILVGTKTRGWGTIETTVNINQSLGEDEKYALFLVYSLTLNEDNQPIEGQGVSPTIQINDPGWEKQLFAYFHYEELTEAVKEIWNKPPESI